MTIYPKWDHPIGCGCRDCCALDGPRVENLIEGDPKAECGFRVMTPAEISERLATVTAERDRLREVLKVAADQLDDAATLVGCMAQCAGDCDDAHKIHEQAEAARAALKGTTWPPAIAT